MSKIEATIIETKLDKLKWRLTNHKSIPKLINWVEGMGKIIIKKDRKSVWTIDPFDLYMVIWRIKGTKIIHKK